MDLIRICGQKPLKGHVKASGSKTVITKLLVASLLSDKKCTFFNVPCTLDVINTLEMCERVGMRYEFDKAAGILEVQTQALETTYIPQRFSKANRIPILMLGALLSRTDEEIIIPTLHHGLSEKASVNSHINALRALGADIEYRKMRKEGAFFASSQHGLTGCSITLPYPSIGATENIILAAVAAKGPTIIKNASIEPEVIELILFLQKLGAIILIDCDRTIQIEGTRRFFEVEHTIITDRIEAANLGISAIATKGDIFVEGADHATMIPFLNKLREIGGGFTVKQNGIQFYYEKPLKSDLHLETDTYPGFMTDWQPGFCVLLTQAKGSSIVHETVYEKRFGYASQLASMGADISLFKQCLGGRQCRFSESHHPHSIVIRGKTELSGAHLEITNPAHSFALLIAALVAKGESTLTGTHFVDRSYESLVQKLRSIDADIEHLHFEEDQECFVFQKKS